ncbi:MAG: branched-chain amino acid ABC transporter permease [Rhodospirillales bacterium]|nr:branched-chain amino acid ABC transporter permease [Rhodospirillales bacterium]MCW8861820.1 branched-chain amino acid ABC transporter permease [Rhodospirillales bacterium]MCW8952341.1 branched-chain amino acid ABC transporter permease [Rhodospirillales bacterium]MCW8971011.1 branched-chain amino acid ABC transporter permease [Rhodospirillales bacterium]MCW9002769.1 branched-chain amino acid ABC transporter permease [Rhodospirillales bacterium]
MSRVFANPTNLFLLTALAMLAAFPWFGESFYVGLVVRIMILGILAMSLDLLIGYTGLVSFGHAAFFGLAGYLLAIVTPETGPVSIWYALPVCLGGAALAALVIGWFSVRTSGIYFIMITLAFAQMLYYFFNENMELGGSDGIFIFYKPSVAIGDFQILDLGDHTTFYYFVLVSLILVYALLRVILNAPFGQVLRGIKINEARTQALGFSTFRYKLASFVIAGTIGGYAGFLEATHNGIMSPDFLGWHKSGSIMMIVILGGIGTLWGAVVGAFAMVFLQDWFQELTTHWLLLMGGFVIFVVLFLPRGIAGLVESFSAFLTRAVSRASDKDAP